jgi:hypothetical protein
VLKACLEYAETGKSEAGTVTVREADSEFEQLDGAGYHSSRSAPDRDRLWQQVLVRLQWNIYRIWPTDWFQNSEEQLGRLLRHLDTLLQNDL